MFKKIISVGLLVATLSLASSVSVFAQTNLIDETKTVSSNNKTGNEKLRESLFKKETNPNFDKKETMSDYHKQKSQGKKLSTGTIALIGVGAAVAIVVVLLVVRYGINE